MRWKLLVRSLALLLAGVVGCKQTVYVTEEDLTKYKELGLPANLANDPQAESKPVVQRSAEPPDIFSPDRPIRYISLAEAIAIALETGTVGNPSTIIANLFGNINSQQTSTDQLPSFNGGTNGRVGQSDSIRVLRLDPAIIGAGIEASLSKFDAVFTSSMSWTTTDRPIASSQDAIQAGNGGLTAITQQEATFSTGIVKPLPSGGVVGITFNVPYQFTNLPARVNPNYRPDVQLSFEQPLLQGFGVDINQLRAALPVPFINQGILNTQPTAEGILITRVRFDQQRAEFERNVHIMVLNVETSYWNLAYSYWNLWAQERALEFALRALNLAQARLAAGRANIADVGLPRAQYEALRSTRMKALNDVIDLQRQFRAILGMQGDDGKRLVPSDQPTLARYIPDWHTAQEEALALRPELYLARQEVKVAQMNLLVQKNNLLPDLRFGATYDVNAIGSRLDGPDATQNAFRALASDHFNNWSAQLRLNVPIGYRVAHSNVRIAQLQLARAYETLADAERKTISFLTQQYERLPLGYELIRSNKAALEANKVVLDVKQAEVDSGKSVESPYYEALSRWATSVAQEHEAIRDYNNSLAAYEWAKGTILSRNNIVISEGALPGFAQKRAVEHLAERSAALELRERPSPVTLGMTAPGAGAVGNPQIEDAAPAPQNLWKPSPVLQEVGPLPATGDAPKSNVTTGTPVTTRPAVTGTPVLTVPSTPFATGSTAVKELPPTVTAPTQRTTTDVVRKPSEFGLSRTPPSDGPIIGSPPFSVPPTLTPPR